MALHANHLPQRFDGAIITPSAVPINAIFVQYRSILY
nr:MAG TPA: hypothetical protein [Caudoviricetes sp.]